MKILILGAGGMLGHKLCQKLSPKYDVSATVRGSRAQIDEFGVFDGVDIIENIDAMDFSTVRKAIENKRPDVVINAIGVIKQLPSSKDVVTALTINSILPQKLAELAGELGFRLFCISTDCVFAGTRGNYRDDDVPDAIDLYGRSKAFGEVDAPNCLTLRTSIIGRELRTENSLVDWFLSNRGKKIKGFTKAIYSGFPTVVFADIINDLIANFPDLEGLYNVSSDAIDKFTLLNLINEAFSANVDIEPFDDFVIDRSLNSDRFREATGFRPQTWEKMVKAMAEDAKPYDKWKQ